MGRPLLSSQLEDAAPLHSMRCTCAACASSRPNRVTVRIPSPARDLQSADESSSQSLWPDNQNSQFRFRDANSALEAAFARLETLRATLQSLERDHSSSAYTMRPNHNALVLSDGDAREHSRPGDQVGSSISEDNPDEWFGRTLRTVLQDDGIADRLRELHSAASIPSEQSISSGRPRSTALPLAPSIGHTTLLEILQTRPPPIRENAAAIRVRNTNERNLEASVRDVRPPVDSDHSALPHVSSRTPSTRQRRPRFPRSHQESDLNDRSSSRADLLASSVPSDSDASTLLGRRLAARLTRSLRHRLDDDDSSLQSGVIRSAGSSSSARSLVQRVTRNQNQMSEPMPTRSSLVSSSTIAGSRFDDVFFTLSSAMDVQDHRDYRTNSLLRQTNHGADVNISVPPRSQELQLPSNSSQVSSDTTSGPTRQRAADGGERPLGARESPRIRIPRRLEGSITLGPPVEESSSEDDDSGLRAAHNFRAVMELVMRPQRSALHRAADRQVEGSDSFSELPTQQGDSTLPIEHSQADDAMASTPILSRYICPLPQPLEDMTPLPRVRDS